MSGTKFIIEMTKTGYSGYKNKLPVFTIDTTILDLKHNSLEALDLHIGKKNKNVQMDHVEFESIGFT